MVRHIFSPECFAPPFRTIPVSELVFALVNKNLGKAQLPVSRKSKPRRPMGKKTSIVIHRCENDVIEDLISGNLIAHVFVEKTNMYLRIPNNYWKDELCGLTLSGILYDLDNGKVFNKSIEGGSAIVIDSYAKAWLLRMGISDTDQFFPHSFLSQQSIAQARRSTRFHWQSFEDAALNFLRENGAFSGVWIQARLEEKMCNWCINEKWEKIPSEKMIRDHVKEACRRYLTEKKGN